MRRVLNETELANNDEHHFNSTPFYYKCTTWLTDRRSRYSWIVFKHEPAFELSAHTSTHFNYKRNCLSIRIGTMYVTDTMRVVHRSRTKHCLHTVHINIYVDSCNRKYSLIWLMLIEPIRSGRDVRSKIVLCEAAMTAECGNTLSWIRAAGLVRLCLRLDIGAESTKRAMIRESGNRCADRHAATPSEWQRKRRAGVYHIVSNLVWQEAKNTVLMMKIRSLRCSGTVSMIWIQSGWKHNVWLAIIEIFLSFQLFDFCETVHKTIDSPFFVTDHLAFNDHTHSARVKCLPGGGYGVVSDVVHCAVFWPRRQSRQTSGGKAPKIRLAFEMGGSVDAIGDMGKELSTIPVPSTVWNVTQSLRTLSQREIHYDTKLSSINTNTAATRGV